MEDIQLTDKVIENSYQIFYKIIMKKKIIEALIYKPVKTAMQSGNIYKDYWVIKFILNSRLKLDPLMGWAGSSDTRKQIVLKFDSCSEAVNYAEKKNISYRILKEKKKSIKPKSYADNFSYDRKNPWTH